MNRVEIAIVGAGPAGVSAAITAKARNKEILLFGSTGMSEKVTKSHGIRNYPGLPDVTGEELAAAFTSHLEQMEVPVIKEQVSNIYAMGDYYAIQTSAGMYESETLILATGVVLDKPLKGEDEFLGKGVSYCATCDAFFYRGKTVAVLGYNEEAVSETEFLATVCEKVYYLPVKGEAHFEADNVQLLSGKPLEIQGGMKVENLVTDQESIPVDGIFILKDAVSPEKLVHGLKIDGAHVEVNLQMETNLPGCFACGDVAGKPYQYIKSAGQGNIAALSAVNYLAKKR